VVVCPCRGVAGPEEPDTQPHRQAEVLFPVHLPECKLAEADLHARYGLKEHSKEALVQAPLGPQLTIMREWCMRKVQMDRRGGAVNLRTWENIMEGVSGYLGYLKKHEDVAHPQLQHFMSPFHYSKFMAFLLARGTRPIHQQQHIGHARKVVEHMCSQAANPYEGQQQRLKLLQWYSTLHAQLSGDSCGHKRLHLRQAAWEPAAWLI
jgi:hypothetical protein